MTKEIFLKPGKEHSVLRGHPWIFSGAIADAKGLIPGDVVNVYAAKGLFLATGHWSDGSIAVRILDHAPIENRNEFWLTRLKNCLELRTKLGFGIDTPTTAFRLIHGEGDGLPGLICDIYGTCAVLQAHSKGMYLELPQIAAALDQVFDFKLSSIYSKSKASMHDETIVDQFFKGNETETVALENGISFKVNWSEGQKTGFFLDQRENRKLLEQYSKNKKVLNTFSYSGGFSVYALRGAASKVSSVDISAKAVQLCNENVALLGADLPHEGITADVLQYLREQEELYDIVILDPPAFAKKINKKHSAVMGYKRLNALGMQRVKPGGLLFTFSCSQVIDNDLFANTITAAGIEAGRNARILYRLGQGPDHPVNLYHPEGHYLKGLVLQVD
ncbi:MAG: class I SAM-dependent rRNA methyltransferase [Bacteroidia bacterium]|nr:class I SAM-dependent rRNA methyltransferase [Bacteroidia bacterium]